jgi:hypothetical protein
MAPRAREGKPGGAMARPGGAKARPASKTRPAAAKSRPRGARRARAPRATGKSPRITNVAWGRVKVEGGQIFKDVKLFPGGAREWNWDETGTQHNPGILPADVQELIDNGATVVVLSKGMLGMLGVTIDAMLELGRKDIPVHVLKTEEAVRRYNALCKTEAVGALIHSTC